MNNCNVSYIGNANFLQISFTVRATHIQIRQEITVTISSLHVMEKEAITVRIFSPTCHHGKNQLLGELLLH